GIREAREGDLTFLANPRYEPYLEITQASAIIVAENHKQTSKPLIQNPNPYLAFLKAVRFFAGPGERPEPGVDGTAVIAADATVAPDASIGPHVVIGAGASIGARSVLHAGCYVGARVRIGEDALLYPHAVVREDCILGDRVIVHPGAVVGS